MSYHWTCDTTNNGGSGGTSIAVSDDTGLYYAFGRDAAGNDFCCVKQGTLCYLNVNGSPQVDQIDLQTLDAHSNFTCLQLVTTVNAGSDNDYIEGADTSSIYTETLNGDAGNDEINGNDGDDTINGGDEPDTISGGYGSDTINGNGSSDTICGDECGIDDLGDPDVIYGGDGKDDISGGGGDDIIHGNSGTDSVCGDDGEDSLYGDGNDDWVFGGNDADTIQGGTHNVEDTCGGSTDSKTGCEVAATTASPDCP